MKKLFFIIFALFTVLNGLSQNVGIGTTSPASRLQINHFSSTTTGLSLVDSTSFGSSSIEFRNVNNTRRILMQGYTSSNFNNGQYLDIKSDSSFIATFKGNGRLGINNLDPAFPLDVTGDVNTTGALRVNGNAGSNGQLLRSNGDGTMKWDDMCQYNNFITLKSITPSTWTVPAGVTKIVVEAWGAGGGGNVLAGGGGGGYVKAHFIVTPGSVISFTTGDGGLGSTTTTSSSGTNTTCTVAGVTITAGGAQGALYLTAANGQGGTGGSFSISGSFSNYIGIMGGSGKSQERTFYQYNATTFYESGKGGRGGDSPKHFESGGAGQTYLYNTTGSVLVFRNGNPATGLVPGGGGASGVQYGSTTIGGGSGADGILIVYY